MITIIDYGLGNLGSLVNMHRHLGLQVEVASDVEHISRADKLVLPGVGSYDAAMRNIARLGLRDILDYKALQQKVPILGVCLGMQLLMRGSEEGELAGLGWIPGDVVRFPRVKGLKVPHMGWNVARPTTVKGITEGLGEEPRYYFVHSYCVHVDDPSHSLMTTHYGVDFDSAVCKGNIYGMQFHPEKSHRFGMQTLKNFAALSQ